MTQQNYRWQPHLQGCACVCRKQEDVAEPEVLRGDERRGARRPQVGAAPPLQRGRRIRSELRWQRQVLEQRQGRFGRDLKALQGWQFQLLQDIEQTK